MPVYKDEERRTWYVKLSYIDKFGSRKYHTKRGFKMRKQAREYEDRYMDAVKNDDLVDGVKFSTLAEEYKAWYAKRRKPSSIKTINNYVDNHLIPYFKNMDIFNIRTNDILKFQEAMIEKGLSKGYIQDIHTCLVSVLNHGMKFHDLKRNVASITGNIENDTITKWDYWTLQEFETFFDYLEEYESLYWQTYFRLLFFSGLRHGEQRALTWKDINFDQLSVTINKTNYNGKVHAPKTKTSIRTVYLPGHVIELLKDYLTWYKENEVYKEDYVVFGTFYQSIGDTTVAKKYNNVMKELDLKQIKIHEFRHSHASDCINRLNMDKATLAKRLGHSSSVTIEKVYGHLYPSTEKSAIMNL